MSTFFLRTEDDSDTAEKADVPPFCLETAGKALASSTLVYLEPNSRGLTPEKYSELLSYASKPLVEGEDAPKLVELKEFYNRKGLHTVRCLCAALEQSPGPGMIRVVIRGTDTFGNVVADAKAVRVPHPPKRGIPFFSMPGVHHGFLDAWRGDGLKASVIEFVKKHTGELCKKSNGEKVLIDIAGHSLGGSIAVLAAFDLAVELKDTAIVRLYTFGCPRVGNVAFVKEFNKAVPNCWNVINDNDIVPAVPHSSSTWLWKGYRRHGQSVLINDNGGMIVKPSRKQKLKRERQVMSKLGGALTAHETGCYRNSLRAVFQKEGLLDPNDKRSTPELRALDERLGVLDETITEARADPSRSFRLLPGAT